MTIDAMDAVFRALADASRRELLDRLRAENGQTLGQLCARLAKSGVTMTRQAVSKHLRALEDAGLVRSTRAGRERIWELETRRLAEASHWLSVISTQWDEALGRLKLFVERQEESA